MKKNQKLSVIFGCLMLLSCVAISAQVLGKRSAPVQAPAAAETKKLPTEQIIAAPPPEKAPAEPESKTYEKPRYMDDRLDWCMYWASGCGRPAAVTFCHRKRFEVAASFDSEVVGRSAQTRLMGSNEACNADWCTAFSYITCSQPIADDRVFANPRWKDRRLDVCRQRAFGCGRPAADAFCRAKGFSESLDFTVDLQPSNTPTRLIGTDETCDQNCQGFQQIICK